MPNDIFADADQITKEIDDEIKDLEAGEEADTEEVLKETEKKIQPAEEEEEKKPAAEADEEDEDDLPEELPTNKKDQGAAFAKARQTAKAERDRRLATEKENRDFREQLAKLTGTVEGMKSSRPQVEEPKKVDEDPEPDATIDAEEHLRWENRQIKKEIAALKGDTTQTKDNQRAILESQAVEVLEKQFTDTTPDYKDAVKFVYDKEFRQIKRTNPQASDSDIHNYLKAEKIKLFKTYYSSDKSNAGKVIMEMAEEYGYKKAAAPNENKPKLNLDALSRNQKKSASVIGGSGGGKGGEVDADAVFSGAFESLARKNPKFFDEAIKAAQHED